jgi:hypothetical protein
MTKKEDLIPATSDKIEVDCLQVVANNMKVKESYRKALRHKLT